jgi:hypothetical protein
VGTIWKRRESKVAVEGRRLFILGFNHYSEYSKRTGCSEHPTNRVCKQKIADPLATNALIARETSDQRSRNRIVTRQPLCVFRRKVGKSKRESTQAIKAYDSVLIVDRDKNTGNITFLVLACPLMEPFIEHCHSTRKPCSVMLAECYDCLDHARSSELLTMALQSIDKARGRIGLAADRCEKCVAIRSRKNHTLMLIKKPARALEGKIAGGKPGHRHCLLDHSLRRGG